MICTRCGQNSTDPRSTVFCPKVSGGGAHTYPPTSLYGDPLRGGKSELEQLEERMLRRFAANAPPRPAMFSPLPFAKRVPFPLPSTRIRARSTAVIANDAQVVSRPVLLVVSPLHAHDFIISDVTIGIRPQLASFRGELRGDMFPPVPDPEKIKGLEWDFDTLEVGRSIVLSAYNDSDEDRVFSAMFYVQILEL